MIIIIISVVEAAENFLFALLIFKLLNLSNLNLSSFFRNLSNLKLLKT